MKNLLLTIVAFVVFTSCSKAQKTTFSDKALSEKLTSIDGLNVPFSAVLKNHAGKTVVIELWASWCSDCVKAMPKLKELQKNNPNVDYVFISLDKTMDKWIAGIEKHELKGDHYWVSDGMKGSFGQAIDLDWIPRYIIIDKTGKIVTYRAIETDFEQINKTLKNLK